MNDLVKNLLVTLAVALVLIAVFQGFSKPAGGNPQEVTYSTFLGGTNLDLGSDIAVDGRGSAYVTGIVISADYPTTRGAFDTTYNGVEDAFVTKLPTG